MIDNAVSALPSPPCHGIKLHGMSAAPKACCTSVMILFIAVPQLGSPYTFRHNGIAWSTAFLVVGSRGSAPRPHHARLTAVLPVLCASRVDHSPAAHPPVQSADQEKAVQAVPGAPAAPHDNSASRTSSGDAGALLHLMHSFGCPSPTYMSCSSTVPVTVSLVLFISRSSTGGSGKPEGPLRSHGSCSGLIICVWVPRADGSGSGSLRRMSAIPEGGGGVVPIGPRRGSLGSLPRRRWAPAHSQLKMFAA